MRVANTMVSPLMSVFANSHFLTKTILANISSVILPFIVQVVVILRIHTIKLNIFIQAWAHSFNFDYINGMFYRKYNNGDNKFKLF